jgi:hydroxyacylglutathione hydrolase
VAEAARFFQRLFPSANALLLTGERPVLVDGGFGADVPALIDWLHAQCVPPERLSLVVNTHFDCDHAGANHALAERYGLPIAAHRIEAAAVNARDPAACRARYLHQPVEPYRVAWSLEQGDVIDTGAARWTVLHTPGHTDGHISLHAAELGLLVTGDAVHSDDLGWIDATRPEALDAAEATTRRLAELRVARAWSGHGPATSDPAAAIAEAARRLQGWRRHPERMAWHGAKRVFAYDLMVVGGLQEHEIAPFLLDSPWFSAYAAMPFGLTPAAFMEPLLAEMLRSAAAVWQGGRLVAGNPFTPPPPGWARAATEPARWPA